ncbi:MAG TPA: (2Fe-2S)-binding protein [Candidatus Cloacimonadota bacterium]|nr:(2Fe-2S)-binding protein [Candidatus Cloacimonadota bacterium]HPS39507.1 (2Fe-2S)-binding protein [Candidatus Cloacimonadota bacterium]
MKEIKLIVNHEERSVWVEPNEVLLDVLRDKLGVKSPKCGCERGDCGACTVLLDGKVVRSCLVLAVEVENHSILTVEGLSPDRLTAIQEAFIEYNSFQCGYCAPGIILAITELLGREPHPSLADIKESIAGNLCRCTGYTPIFDAIMALTGMEDK